MIFDVALRGAKCFLDHTITDIVAFRTKAKVDIITAVLWAQFSDAENPPQSLEPTKTQSGADLTERVAEGTAQA